MEKKKICVLGGGGFVGHRLVSQLVAQGHQVVVPTRRRDRVKSLTVLPTVEVVEVDIHDGHELVRLFQGVDTVINLVGILHGSKKAFVNAHVKLPHKVMEACRSAGVSRLLHMSALGADSNAKSFYQHSKGEGERIVLEPSRQHDLEVTVFRPSVIFGPGDSFLRLFAQLLGMAPVMPLASPGARFQPVHVDDVVRAFLLSLDDETTYGQAYNLCGPRVYTLVQLVGMTAATLGLQPRIVPLGETASYWFARLMELKPGRKLMTRDNWLAMQTDNVCAEGFPARFGQPMALETCIGYLREDGQRRTFDRYRTQAHR